jgi:hypothetical protein
MPLEHVGRKCVLEPGPTMESSVATITWTLRYLPLAGGIKFDSFLPSTSEFF